jgi:hypothetical protein
MPLKRNNPILCKSNIITTALKPHAPHVLSTTNMARDEGFDSCADLGWGPFVEIAATDPISETRLVKVVHQSAVGELNGGPGHPG